MAHEEFDRTAAHSEFDRAQRLSQEYAQERRRQEGKAMRELTILFYALFMGSTMVVMIDDAWGWGWFVIWTISVILVAGNILAHMFPPPERSEERTPERSWDRPEEWG